MGDEFWRTGNTSANRHQLSLREPRVGVWRRFPQSIRRSGGRLVAVASVVVVPLAGHFPWIERAGLVLKTVGLFTR